MTSNRVVDLAELARIESRAQHEVDRIAALSDVYIELPAERTTIAGIDPFSTDYLHAVTSWLETITGRAGYNPARDELSNYLESPDPADKVAFVPAIYRVKSSVFLGEMLQSFGAVLKALDVREGHSVLEYGPGDGQISLALARIGCEVTAVDIEQRYLEQIDAQAAALRTSIRTIQGPFGTAEPGRRYDRILFFEAFHHALAHHELVRTLRDQLMPEGYIVFAGEPILAVDNYFRCILPYPWGPRLDGLSVQTMRSCGWCELGYTREYFIEMLMRAGFVVGFRDNPSTSRGSAYIASAAGATIDFGGPMLLEAVGMPNCWHPGEGTFRFMRSPVAGIPIDGASQWRWLSLELHQHLPLACDLKIILGDWETKIRFQPGEARRVSMPVPKGGGVLRLEGAVHRPSDLSPATSKDDRCLGIAVAKLSYYDTAYHGRAATH